MSDNNKVRITGLFDSKFGYSVKVTDKIVEALSQVEVGGFLNVNISDDGFRTEQAAKYGKEFDQTAAASLTFSAGNGASATKSPAPAPAERPAPTTVAKKPLRVTKF